MSYVFKADFGGLWRVGGGWGRCGFWVGIGACRAGARDLVGSGYRVVQVLGLYLGFRV